MLPLIRNIFKRQQEEYYVVSQKEHIIDCKYTKRKARIPIINKRIINKEIQEIKAKEPIKYVHLGGTEILIKVCFREGIDTPIEIYLADDRIVEPIERSIISVVKGNLIYQKFKFIISANYSVAINDRNIDMLFSEDPLKGWENHKTKVKIELIDENNIITQKPLKYNFEDLKEFKMHIKELLENKYIQESNSKHTSPTFIVNKHSEQKRGKSHMVIDYRNLNAKTKTYNYPIPNKVLKVRQIQGYNYFSKFDCKS